MKILVVDAQGGGIGKILVEKLSERCKGAEIIAVGTNSSATVNMLKGAKVNGATGENAVVFNAGTADVIIGAAGIVMANAMFGEVTPRMAEAITSSQAEIVLIPMSRCRARIVGIEEKKISEYVDEAVEYIVSLME